MDTVLDLSCACGTCEQYFAEVKSELDLQRLPSGKCYVNELFFQLGILVNNMLRGIGSGIISGGAGGLRPATRRRLRTVIQNLMYLCGSEVRHARSPEIIEKVHSRYFWEFGIFFSDTNAAI